jgi:hypothetical protein
MYVRTCNVTFDRRSSNHCWSGKAMSITQPECVFVASVSSMWCACAVFSSVVCPAIQYFSTFSHKRHDFRGGKKLLNIKCVVWFPLQLLSEEFFILRGTERDMIKMFIGLHVKYPLFFSDFNETWIFSADFRKVLKCRVPWKSVQCEPSCSMRTVGRIWRI